MSNQQTTGNIQSGKMFDVSIILINNEVVVKKLDHLKMKALRNTIYTRGFVKELADGSIEIISPLIIKTVIIKPIK